MWNSKMRLERDDYTILSVPWSIREVPSGSAEIDDCYAKVSWTDYTIYISSDGPWQERMDSLLHETLHIITKGRGKCDLAIEDDLRCLSEVLTDTLIRNHISFDPDNISG